MVVQRTTDNCEFRLYLPHASVVEVVGDFTSWQESAVAMHRAQDGWWSALVRVPRGEHRFSYLVDGRYWMPDYAAHGIEHNANGQWVSRLAMDTTAAPFAAPAAATPLKVGENAVAPPQDRRRSAPTPGRAAEPVVRSHALGPWLGGTVAARAVAG